VRPIAAKQQRKRRKNNQIDARTLTSNLFNYLSGNQEALQLVRVPTEEQEQARLVSRQHDQLVKERKRLAAEGNSLLMSQGLGSYSNRWRPKAFSHFQQSLPGWIVDMLQARVDLLVALSKTDMPDRRLPCPTERWTESFKRKRVQSDQSAQQPF
jgi:transposase